MKRLIGLFILLTVLSGCAGQADPWSAPAAEARGAPSAIVPAAETNPMQAQIAPPSPPATAQAQAAAPVRVALLLPLSGRDGALGRAMAQAAQLALFDMGYDGLELMPRDTAGQPQKARAEAERAMDDGAQLILGPLFSGEVQAVRPAAAGRGVNLVAFSTDWTQAGGNAFVMGFLPFSQVQRIVEYAAAKGYKRIGVVAPTNDYGNAVASYYAAVMARYGLASGPVVRVGDNGADMSRALAPLAQGQPVDAVLLAMGGDQASRAASALTLLGLPPGRVRRLGTGLWDDSALSSNPDMQGAWYAAPQPELRRTFENKYAAAYGQEPPRLATLAYDATALAVVLARGGAASKGRPLFDRASLANANGFSGVDGVFRFQPDGRVDRGMAVMEMGGGSARVIDPAPRTFQRSAF